MVSSLMASGIAVASNANANVSSTTSTNAYKFAKSQIGKDYVLGTEGLRTYDCSGLVWRSYKEVGYHWKVVGRSTRLNANDQRRYQTNDITKSQRRLGDLIFFEKNGDGDKVYDHVGIYAGSGYMIDAQTSDYYGHGVIKEKVDNSWWSSHYSLDYRRVK